LLQEWNSTNVEYPRHKCVHELFAEQVERNPQAIALQFGQSTLTYAGLNRRANRVAHRLRRLGVAPDVRVAVCLERGFDLVAGILGVLKAGGAYVPLDPRYPADRLRYMVEDSGPVAVLSERGVKDRLPRLCPERMVMEMDAGLEDEPEN